MYGRVRLGGTIGYGVTGPIAGLLIQNHGLRWAFWGYAFLNLLGFVYDPSEPEHATRGRVRSLLANPRWPLFLAVAFAGGAGLAAVNNYLFSYMEGLGASESTRGFSAPWSRDSAWPWGGIRRRPVVGKRRRARPLPRLWSRRARHRGRRRADSKTSATGAGDITRDILSTIVNMAREA
jgi:hypothetical protein